MLQGFQDILADLNIKDPKYGTFNGFKTLVDYPQRIDYIFQKFKVLKAEHLWIKTPEGLWASDHHPFTRVLVNQLFIINKKLLYIS